MEAPVRIDDSARRSQKNFRILLQAMNRPGRVFRLEALHFFSPAGPALALAECLLDHEVSFCVAGDRSIEAIYTAILSATCARPASVSEADFIFILGSGSGGAVWSAKRGSPEFPEEGATLIYCHDSSGHPETERFRIRLSGPGIPEPHGIAPEMRGIALEELRDLRAVNADYPLGVDCMFIQPGGELMCLPRSTRIQAR